MNTSVRRPPYNAEAEQSLLGCIMRDPATVLFECNHAGIVEASFYVPAHRRIYATMLKLAHERGPDYIDLLTVGNALKAVCEIVGGDLYLAKCYDAGVDAGHALGIVSDNASRREIIEAVRELECTAYDIEEPVPEMVTGFVGKMIELGAGKKKRLSPQEIHNKQQDDWRRVQSGERIGLPPRWIPVEALVSSFKPGQLIIVGASTSDGKTMFALNQCEYAALTCETAVAVASAEMTEQELRTRMACSMARVNARRMESPYATAEDWAQVSEAFASLASLPIYIEDANMTIDGWCTWAINMKARHNIGMLIVDYLQLIQTLREDKHRHRTEVIGEMSHSLKRLAKRLNIPILALSQFNRAGDKRERDVTPPPPLLASLRDSGEIEQDADVVILLSKRQGISFHEFEDDRDWLMTLDVAKNRNGPTGKVPMIMMRKVQRWVSESEYENINKQT